MLAFPSQLLTLAAIATACLAPFVAGQSPTYMYAGPKCGDVETSTCPGKPYPGSSFSGAFCGAAFGASPGLTYQTLPTFSVQACANACRHYAAFGVLSWRSVCWCMDSANSNPTSVTSCGTRDQRSYYHEPLQASAGLARRQLASERRARERDTTLCPTGLTACRVESSEDGYECLDTASELESCGGCRHGIFSAVLASASLPDRKKAQNLLERRGQSALSLRADVSGPIGVDCSDRRTFGPNMTCRQGSCVSF